MEKKLYLYRNKRLTDFISEADVETHDDFNENIAYVIGAIVMHRETETSGKIAYIFTAGKDAGAWDSSKVEVYSLLSKNDGYINGEPVFNHSEKYRGIKRFFNFNVNAVTAITAYGLSVGDYYIALDNASTYEYSYYRIKNASNVDVYRVYGISFYNKTTGELFSIVDNCIVSPYVKFPNDDGQVTLFDFTYSSERMGTAPKISSTMYSFECYDLLWNVTDSDENRVQSYSDIFTFFNGERYYLEITPTSSFSNEDARYRHELSFVSERIVLENIIMMNSTFKNYEEFTPAKDYVSGNYVLYENLVYRFTSDHAAGAWDYSQVDQVPGESQITESTDFTFSGNITEFTDRINASIASSGITNMATITGLSENNHFYGYHAVFDYYDEFSSTEKYVYGDIVTHTVSGVLSYYRFISGHAAGVWNQSEVEVYVLPTKLISISGSTIYDALGLIESEYGLSYYIDSEKTIHIRKYQTEISDTIEYGSEKSLISITRSNMETKIVTRMTAIGSSDNIPYYYPNPSEYGFTSPKASAATGKFSVNPPTDLPLFTASFTENPTEKFYSLKTSDVFLFGLKIGSYGYTMQENIQFRYDSSANKLAVICTLGFNDNDLTKKYFISPNETTDRASVEYLYYPLNMITDSFSSEDKVSICNGSPIELPAEDSGIVYTSGDICILIQLSSVPYDKNVSVDGYYMSRFNLKTKTCPDGCKFGDCFLENSFDMLSVIFEILDTSDGYYRIRKYNGPKEEWQDLQWTSARAYDAGDIAMFENVLYKFTSHQDIGSILSHPVWSEVEYADVTGYTIIPIINTKNGDLCYNELAGSSYQHHQFACKRSIGANGRLDWIVNQSDTGSFSDNGIVYMSGTEILSQINFKGFTLYKKQWAINGTKAVEMENYGITIGGSSPKMLQEVHVISDKYLTPQSSLMPEIYFNTNGDRRFYPAKNYPFTKTEDYELDEDAGEELSNSNVINNNYQNDGGESIIFENQYKKSSPKEHVETFDDIKPTIKECLNVDGDRIDVVLEFKYDETDSDELKEIDSDNTDSLNYKHPYFFAKLRKLGFNIFDLAIDEEDMVLNITSGPCGSGAFKIMVGSTHEQNTVRVWKYDVYEFKESQYTKIYKKHDPMQYYNGTLYYDTSATSTPSYAKLDDTQYTNLPDDKEWGDIICTDVTLESVEDCQKDTTDNEVWVALLKDVSTFGTIIPSKIHSIEPVSYTDSQTDFDTFVLTHILMPQAYIRAAEKKLTKELIKYMGENNAELFSYAINFSRIYFAQHAAIQELMNENSLLKIKYAGHAVKKVYVSSFTYKMTESDALPEISVELKDTIAENKYKYVERTGTIVTGGDTGQSSISKTGTLSIKKIGRTFVTRNGTNQINGNLVVTGKVTGFINAILESGKITTLNEIGRSIQTVSNNVDIERVRKRSLSCILSWNRYLSIAKTAPWFEYTAGVYKDTLNSTSISISAGNTTTDIFGDTLADETVYNIYVTESGTIYLLDSSYQSNDFIVGILSSVDSTGSTTTSIGKLRHVSNYYGTNKVDGRAVVGQITDTGGDVLVDMSNGELSFKDNNGAIKSVKNVDAKVKTIDSSVTALDESVTALNGDVETINGNITTIKGDITTLDDNIAATNTNVTTLNSTVTTLNSKITDGNTGYDVLYNAVKQLQGTLNQKQIYMCDKTGSTCEEVVISLNELPEI